MRGHCDVGELMMSVPYIPTLGPVHPSVCTPGLWDDVLSVNGTGRHLPHDKDVWWQSAKDERVLTDAIAADEAGARIPTLLRRGRGVLKVHHYGARPDLPTALDTAGKLAAEHGTARARVVWFNRYPDQSGHGCRIQLKSFDQDEPPPSDSISTLDMTPADVGATLGDFALDMADEGFGFLADRMRAGFADGPILVASADERVVGAIGPMGSLPDSRGQSRLLPQYFAVLPSFRGKGLGRALWRAAMRWGWRNGAHYQLLQTEIGGASDRLCQQEGLAELGFAYTVGVDASGLVRR